MTRSNNVRKLPSPARDHVANWLRQRIAAGRYKPGERLPSSRQLARRFTVSQDTGARALELLGEEGLAVKGGKRREGWFTRVR